MTCPDYIQMECKSCGHPQVDIYLDDDGARKFASHRSAVDHPTWCAASDAPVTADVHLGPVPPELDVDQHTFEVFCRDTIGLLRAEETNRLPDESAAAFARRYFGEARDV